jgi:hypothetical protein
MYVKIAYLPPREPRFWFLYFIWSAKSSLPDIVGTYISSSRDPPLPIFRPMRDIHRFDVDTTSIKLEVQDHRQPQAPARALG